MISIIMPAYNAAETISESIDSVLQQSYSNWELLIINDCSSDNTVDIVKKYIKKDHRINLINKSKNEGVAFARNSGLDIAKGDYIAFLDSDDKWLPHKLEIQLDMINKYKVDIVFGSYYRFNEFGILNQVKIPKGIKTYADLLKGNFIGNLTGLYVFKKFQYLRQKKIGAEDYLFWLELLATPGTKSIGVQHPIAYYRVVSSGKSLSANKFKSANWTWNIYHQQLRLGTLESLYYFVSYLIKAITKRI